MSKQYALLLGVEASEGLSPCPFAEEEVRAFASQIEFVGFAKDHQFVLSGSTGSRSAAESRLRKVAKLLQSGDTLWFIYAGPAFTASSGSFLACADTLADDREATSLALSDLVRGLSASGATLRVFLDAPGLSDDELHTLFPSDGLSVALTANMQGEKSHAAKGRRLWLQLVGDAFAGKAPKAIADGEITAEALREWAGEELPRAIRKAISFPEAQTPQVFGPGSAFLAKVTLAEKSAASKLDLKKLKRIVFRGEKRDKWKHLAGYQKNFELPTSASPASQKWTHRLAAENLKTIVEETYHALREQLGFKRKDLESTVETDGLAIIRTPAFDFTVSVSLDSEDLSCVIWRREVSQISNADVLRSDGFRKVFGAVLSMLDFEFDKPIDVEALVDRIEDEPPPGVSVRVASDASSCDVTVQGFAGKIHVERSRLRIEGRPGATPDSLVEQFFAFQNQFGGKKGLPKLRG